MFPYKGFTIKDHQQRNNREYQKTLQEYISNITYFYKVLYGMSSKFHTAEP